MRRHATGAGVLSYEAGGESLGVSRDKNTVNVVLDAQTGPGKVSEFGSRNTTPTPSGKINQFFPNPVTTR